MADTCPMCGEPFEQPPTGRRRSYCSRRCGSRAKDAQRRADTRRRREARAADLATAASSVDATIGQRIRAARESLSPPLSGRALGRLLGVTISIVGSWERDECLPTAEHAEALEGILPGLDGLAARIRAPRKVARQREALEQKHRGKDSRLSFGELLRLERTRQRLTRTQLGERAGVSAGAIAQYELGTSLPCDVEWVQWLERALGVDSLVGSYEGTLARRRLARQRSREARAEADVEVACG